MCIKFIMYTRMYICTCVGWKMERGSTCIHCTVLPSHNDKIAKEFITSLKESVSIVRVRIICYYLYCVHVLLLFYRLIQVLLVKAVQVYMEWLERYPKEV